MRLQKPGSSDELLAKVWNFLTKAFNSVKGDCTHPEVEGVSAANVIFWNMFPYRMPYCFDGYFPPGTILLFIDYISSTNVCFVELQEPLNTAMLAVITELLQVVGDLTITAFGSSPVSMKRANAMSNISNVFNVGFRHPECFTNALRSALHYIAFEFYAACSFCFVFSSNRFTSLIIGTQGGGKQAEFALLDQAVECVFANCSLVTSVRFGTVMLGLLTLYYNDASEASRQTLGTMLGWVLGGKDTDPGACNLHPTTCFIALTLIFKLPLSETRSNNKALRRSGELTPVKVNRRATYVRSVREIDECDETEQ